MIKLTNSHSLTLDRIIKLNYVLIEHLKEPNCSCKLSDILKVVFKDE